MEKTNTRLGNSWWVWSSNGFQTKGPSKDLLWTAVAELREQFDTETGGFLGLSGERESGILLFLLEYARRAEDEWAQAMAEVTLEFRTGPHDALLAYALLEAYAQTGRAGFRKTACAILDQALKELRLPDGAFARKEDKAVSTLWNAQLIAALAKASRVLANRTYLQAAREAQAFLRTRLTRSGGWLWRRWQFQAPMEEGRLADYGFYCWALAELYEADFSVSILREAEVLADRMSEVFRDPRGGFYDFDAAVGSGAAGLALSKLAGLTAIERYHDMAQEQMAWLADAETPDGLALLGMVEELWPRQELVCVSAKRPPAWLAVVGEEYRMAVLAKTPDNEQRLENAVPFLREFPIPEDGYRLYLCRNGVCEAEAENLLQLYRNLSPEGAAV